MGTWECRAGEPGRGGWVESCTEETSVGAGGGEAALAKAGQGDQMPLGE